MNILLTGGTGFLGQRLLDDLIKDGASVFLLVRPKSLAKAKEQYKNNNQVTVVAGDITNPDVIEDFEEQKKVVDSTDVIVHAAAYYNLEANYSDSFVNNVVGTQNILFLAGLCKSLKSFHYVSTVAVAGNYRGHFPEKQLQLGQKFENHYAKTKFDAEVLVREWHLGDIQKRIHRLGILVGDSKSGYISKIDGPYYLFKVLHKWKSKRALINKIKYLPMPFRKNALFPIIPVDHAANFISRIIKDESGEKLLCFHVIGHQNPSMGEFLDDCFKSFGLNVKAIEIPEKMNHPGILKGLGIPSELSSYIYGRQDFDKKYFMSFSDPDQLCHYEDYKGPLFDFAIGSFKENVKGL